MSRRTFLGPSLIVLAAGALGAAGCGGNQTTGTTRLSNTSALSNIPAKVIAITETDFKLTPSKVTVGQPGHYLLRALNKGKVDHALALSGEGIDVHSATVKPGQRTTLLVDIAKPGTYELYCPVDGHRAKGMKGTLVLKPGHGSGVGGGAQTATTQTMTHAGGY